MPDIFTLFGKLEIGTSEFENSLKSAETRLKSTQKAVSDQENQVKNLGNSSAVTARSYEKLTDSVNQVRARLSATSEAFSKGEASASQMRSALLAVEKSAQSASSKLADSAARMSDFAVKSQDAASKTTSSFPEAFKSSFFGNLGASAVTAFTNQIAQLPARVEAVAGKVYDLARGFAESGSQIFDASQKISLSAEALSTIRHAAEISGSSLENFVSGFAKFERTLATGGGKVKSTFEAMGIDIAKGAKDPEAAFSQFLSKFNQLPGDAERTAVAMNLFGKSGAQLIPTFLELGGSLDSAKQKAAALGLVFTSEAAANADRLGDVMDNLTLQVKGLGYQFIGGFAPQISGALGAVSNFLAENKSVVQQWGNYFGSAIETVIGTIKSVSDAFTNLSPAMKTAIGTIAAVAASVVGAIGAIAGFAALDTLIGGTVASIIGAIVSIAPVILPVVAVVGTLAAAGAALYAAWQADFGGLKTFTLEIFDAIKTAIAAAMNAVQSVVADVGGQIVAWWKENYPQIRQTVEIVSEAIKSNVRAFVSTVKGFFEAHGSQIIGIAKQAWETTRTTISGALLVIGNIVKMTMEMINGDWSAAWHSFLQIIQKAVETAVSYFRGMVSTSSDILKNFVVIVVKYGVEAMLGLQRAVADGIAWLIDAFIHLPQKIVAAIPRMIAVGRSIGEAIWQGIKDGFRGAAGDSATNTSNLIGGGSFDLSGLSKKFGSGASGLQVGAQIDWSKLDAGKTKAASLGDALEKTAGHAKKAKDAFKEMNEEIAKHWTSSSLAEFAKNNKFIPTHGFETTGHNTNSKHGANEAQDIRTSDKSVAELVEFLANAIKAGIRTVDERVRPPGEKVWNGSHFHLEENDKKASYFNPALDYGGKLEYLKALDAERLAGHFKSVASALGEVSKQTDPAAELMKSLKDRFDDLTAKTEEQKIALKLLQPEFAGYSKEAKDAILAQARLIDGQNVADSSFERIKSLVKDLTKDFEKNKSELEKANEYLNDPSSIAGITKIAAEWKMSNDQVVNYIRTLARLEDYVNLGKAAPKFDRDAGGQFNPSGKREQMEIVPLPDLVDSSWNNFFDKIRGRFAQLKSDLPTIKESLQENLGSAIERIGDVFSNAIQQWDGTIGGFFKSIGAGFAQMAQEIIKELIRIAVMQAVLKLVGIFAGAAAGGGSGGGSLGHSLGGGSGFIPGAHAAGGYISGAGTSTSDSIFARLSNGEFVVKAQAVSHWGAEFFERLNNLQMPQMAFAGGGFVPGAMLPPSGGVANFSDDSSASPSRSKNGGNTFVSMNVHAKDANSFNLSRRQILSDMQREIDRERLKQGNF